MGMPSPRFLVGSAAYASLLSSLSGDVAQAAAGTFFQGASGWATRTSSFRLAVEPTVRPAAFSLLWLLHAILAAPWTSVATVVSWPHGHVRSPLSFLACAQV